MRPPRLVAIVCAVWMLGACSSRPSAADCARPAQRLGTAVQAYVDEFANVAPGDFSPSAAPAQSSIQVAGAIARYRQEARASGCDAAVLKAAVVSALARIQGKGVVAQTIATTLRTSLARSATLGGATPSPEERRLSPGADLAEAVAGVVPGSRIVLGPGEFKVATPLIVLDALTIAGAGKDRTRVVSTAAGAALLFLGSQTLRLENLTITHSGNEPASLVVIQSGSYTIRGVRISGAKGSGQGRGGVGLLLGAAQPAGGGKPAPRTMRIENSELSGNAVSGITVAGADAPVITGTLVTGSKSCGVCFIGSLGGTLEKSRILSNTIGVTVLDVARPLLKANTIKGNRVGIQARDSSAATIDRNDLTGNVEAAMVFLGKSKGRATGNTCGDRGLGIVLLDSAAPVLSSNRCRTASTRS